MAELYNEDTNSVRVAQEADPPVEEDSRTRLLERARAVYAKAKDAAILDEQPIGWLVDSWSAERLEQVVDSLESIESELGDNPPRPLRLEARLKLDRLFHIQRPVREVDRMHEIEPARRKVLETFPSRIENLDMDRIRKFFEQENLSLGDVVVFHEKDRDLLREALGDFSYVIESIQSAPGAAMAIYSVELDMVFVLRNESVSPHMLEKLIVHELAHGTTGYKTVHEIVFRVANPTKENPHYSHAATRMGMQIMDFRSLDLKGTFFEEGFAESLAQRYKMAYAFAEYETALLANFDAENAEEYAVDLDQYIKTDASFPLPLKYLDTADGFLITPSLAAYGMDMLMERIPTLRSVLHDARAGSVTALREVPRLVNSLTPGLYEELRTLPYTPEGFIRGVNIILAIKGVRPTKQSEPHE